MRGKVIYKKILLIIIVLVSVFLGDNIHAIYTDLNYAELEIENNIKDSEVVLYLIAKQKLSTALDNVILEGKSVLVKNIDNGQVMYNLNADEPRALASVIKLMSTLVAQEEFSELTQFEIIESDLMAIGDFGLMPGDILLRDDLLRLLLIASANDVINVFRRHDESFVDKMNTKAVSLGMRNTVFINGSGWDYGDKDRQTWGTAEDVSILLEAARLSGSSTFYDTRNKVVKVKTLKEREIIIENTNEAIDILPGVLISKTGYTDLAGGNLAMIIKVPSGAEFSVVILGSGYMSRFDDAKILVDTVYKTLAAYPF